MKRKFFNTICILTLCSLLTSCSLKDAITGNNSLSSNDKNEELSDSLKSNDTTDNATNDNSTDTATNEDNSDINDTDTNLSLDTTPEENTTPPESTNDSSSVTDDGTTVTRNCRIFYFNGPQLKTYYIDTKVPVTDNAFVTALTKTLYESPNGSTDLLVIPKEFGVKSATLNYETNVLTVVFNGDFTEKMTLGTSTESGLISAIINTYGYNYGVDKVAIYFGDTLYTGLKGELPEGYFTVNYSDAVALPLN